MVHSLRQETGKNLLLSRKNSTGWEECEVKWGRVQMSIGGTLSDVSADFEHSSLGNFLSVQMVGGKPENGRENRQGLQRKEKA